MSCHEMTVHGVPAEALVETAEARRTEAVLDSSAVGGVHEGAGQPDAVSRAVARDKPR
jgi:hypothetical protein